MQYNYFFTIQSLLRTIGCFALLCMLFGGVSVKTAAQEAQLSMEDVSFPTEDEVIIHGAWVMAHTDEKKPPKRPVALLLHDYGMNLRDWGFFIPDLVQRGYHVLAIDLRGHGQSKGGGKVAERYSDQVAAHLLKSGNLDVDAALEWIKDQKAADTKNIAVIGVGLGADIAYFSAGKFRKILKAAVVISPSFLSVTEGSFTDDSPQAVLLCATSGDSGGASMMAAETLSNFARDPKKLVIYNSAAHGFAIFYKHPEIKQEILQWLR